MLVLEYILCGCDYKENGIEWQTFFLNNVKNLELSASIHLLDFCLLYFENSLKIVKVMFSGSWDLLSVEVCNQVVSQKMTFNCPWARRGCERGIRMISLTDCKWYYSLCLCSTY